MANRMKAITAEGAILRGCGNSTLCDPGTPRVAAACSRPIEILSRLAICLTRPTTKKTVSKCKDKKIKTEIYNMRLITSAENCRLHHTPCLKHEGKVRPLISSGRKNHQTFQHLWFISYMSARLSFHISCRIINVELIFDYVIALFFQSRGEAFSKLRSSTRRCSKCMKTLQERDALVVD